MNASTGPQPRVETEEVAARVERPQRAPRAATVITTLLALLPALAFFAADITRMTIERAAGLPGLPSGITLIGLGFAVAWLYGIGAFHRQFWISAIATPEHPETLSRLDRLDGVGTHTPRNAQTHP